MLNVRSSLYNEPRGSGGNRQLTIQAQVSALVPCFYSNLKGKSTDLATQEMSTQFMSTIIMRWVFSDRVGWLRIWLTRCLWRWLHHAPRASRCLPTAKDKELRRPLRLKSLLAIQMNAASHQQSEPMWPSCSAASASAAPRRCWRRR